MTRHHVGVGVLPTFLAVLLGEDPDRDRLIELPRAGVAAPIRVRVPTDFHGAAAFDEYVLVDDTDWPDTATYRHDQIVPRTPLNRF